MKQVHLEDTYLTDAGGGCIYNYVQNSGPLFKGNISVTHCMPLSSQL